MARVPACSPMAASSPSLRLVAHLRAFMPRGTLLFAGTPRGGGQGGCGPQASRGCVVAARGMAGGEAAGEVPPECKDALRAALAGMRAAEQQAREPPVERLAEALEEVEKTTSAYTRRWASTLRSQYAGYAGLRPEARKVLNDFVEQSLGERHADAGGAPRHLDGPSAPRQAAAATQRVLAASTAMRAIASAPAGWQPPAEQPDAPAPRQPEPERRHQPLHAIVSFDLETTGMLTRYNSGKNAAPDFSEITEIAACDVLDPTNRFERLVRPNQRSLPLREDIVAITGISNEMVLGADGFAAAWEDFRAWVDGLAGGAGPVTLIAHNAKSFDVPVLRNELIRLHHLGAYQSADDSNVFPGNWRFMDTLPIAKAQSGSGGNKLTDLCARYNLDPPSQAHRAMPDAEALARVVVAMAGGARRVADFCESHALAPAEVLDASVRQDDSAAPARATREQRAPAPAAAAPAPAPEPAPLALPAARHEQLRRVPAQVALADMDTWYDTDAAHTPRVAEALERACEPLSSAHSTTSKTLWTLDLQTVGRPLLPPKVVEKFDARGYRTFADVIERWPRRYDVYRPWVTGDAREVEPGANVMFRAYASEAHITTTARGYAMCNVALAVLPFEEGAAADAAAGGGGARPRCQASHSKVFFSRFVIRAKKGAERYKEKSVDPFVRAGAAEPRLWRATVKSLSGENGVVLKDMELVHGNAMPVRVAQHVTGGGASAMPELPAGEAIPAYCRPGYGDDAPLKDADFYGSLEKRSAKIPEGMSVAWHLLTSAEASGGPSVSLDYLSDSDRARISEALAGSHPALAAAPLPTWREAASDMHEPRSLLHLHRAKLRLAFDEMMLLQLYALELSQGPRGDKGARRIAMRDAPERVLAALRGLPYQLTAGEGGQSWVLAHCLRDMGCDDVGGIDAEAGGGMQAEEEAPPMSRLMQGDVGCGKTVVAQLCLLHATQCETQGVLLCATEALAQQHFETFAALVVPGVRVELLTSAVTAKKREQLLRDLRSGDIHILVGTTAILPSKGEGDRQMFRRLGLVVYDECQKYGVKQMDLLAAAGDPKDPRPHTLHVTATPIPRTTALAMTNLLLPVESAVRDVVSISRYPEGRVEVQCHVLEMARKHDAYAAVAQAVERGKVALVVCPRIGDADVPTDAGGLPSAEEELAFLQGQFASQFDVGLVTGGASTKKAAAERMQTLQAFREGRTPVLVCTTVLEVGIDVPNADCIVILGADCFGLATLHQLRGRVGRRFEEGGEGGGPPPTCYFVPREEASEDALGRLKMVRDVTDGFELAEVDLALRGPGSLATGAQAGPMRLLKMASWSDEAMVKAAGDEAGRRAAATSADDGRGRVLEQRLQAFRKSVEGLGGEEKEKKTAVRKSATKKKSARGGGGAKKMEEAGMDAPF